MSLLPFLLFLLFFAGLWLVFSFLLPTLGRGSKALTRRIAERVVRNATVEKWITSRKSTLLPLLPMALILLCGAAVAAVAGDQFMDLAEELRQPGSVLFKVDHTVYDWVAATRSPEATRFFVFFTTVGGPVGVGVVLVFLSALLLWTKRFRWLAYLLVTVGGGGLLNLELKRHFARARPALSAALRQAQGYSFPSGHAMGSVLLWGALSYLAARQFAHPRLRAAVFALSISMILTVALSRIYLGVHWTSDIGAGLTIGLVWLTATTASYETLRRARELRASRHLPPMPGVTTEAP